MIKISSVPVIVKSFLAVVDSYASSVLQFNQPSNIKSSPSPLLSIRYDSSSTVISYGIDGIIGPIVHVPVSVGAVLSDCGARSNPALLHRVSSHAGSFALLRFGDTHNSRERLFPSTTNLSVLPCRIFPYDAGIIPYIALLAR